jgi:3-phenylpropionate/trans-cinnamate dioxygenase ferredoxin reductase subunit
MSKVCTVVVNGEAFSANCGDLLLDAALMNGIDIPHDCRAGISGTCRVRVLDGLILAGRAEDPEAVYACQFPVVSDLTVAVENVPEITTVNGQVFDLIPLASDVVEVSIALPQSSEYLPGQYYKVEFRGFPARCYSPAAPMGGRVNDRMIRLHVRRLPDGRVSSALGRSIRKRHRVKLTGPFGSAYFRPSGPPSRPHRLVLVAGGTGFAPLWSIAYAAMNEWAERELVLVVGARRLESLYMIPALSHLARYRNVTIIPVTSEPQTISTVVRQGRQTDHLPALSPRDLVYAAGAPAMVESVARIAREAGARCYADPFKPMSDDAEGAGLLSRTIAWFGRDGRISSPRISSPRVSSSRVSSPPIAPLPRQRRGHQTSGAARGATSKSPFSSY